MSYTIVIRLSGLLNKMVQRWAKAKKKTRSEIVREALQDYFTRASLEAEADPYAVICSLMPLKGSGISNLAAESETYLRQKFHARSSSH